MKQAQTTPGERARKTRRLVPRGGKGDRQSVGIVTRGGAVYTIRAPKFYGFKVSQSHNKISVGKDRNIVWQRLLYDLRELSVQRAYVRVGIRGVSRTDDRCGRRFDEDDWRRPKNEKCAPTTND